MHAHYAKSLCNAILKSTHAFYKHTHLWKTHLVEIRPVDNKGKQSLSPALWHLLGLTLPFFPLKGQSFPSAEVPSLREIRDLVN